MPSFTDNKDRVWIVRITPYEMREVKDFARINLGTVLQDEMRPLQRILEDPADLCSVLYAICKEQCDNRNVSLRDFMEGIVGDPLQEASGAFLEALRDCFPTYQKAMLTAVITLAKQDEKQTKKKIEKLLSELTCTGSRSLWARLWELIRSVIPGMSWA